MTEDKKKFCIDDIFKEVGEIGKYQLLVFFMVGSTSILSAIGAYQTSFTDATPEYRCKLPMYENDTYEIFSEEQQRLVDLYIPLNKGKNTFDGCSIRTNASLNSSEETCNSWVYSKQYYERTIVTEWDFVCDNLADKGLYKSLFFAGTFGVILIGLLGDRFGRKWVAYTFVVLNALAFLMITLSVNLITKDGPAKAMFGFSRFAIGFTSNIYAIATVIVVEIVGPSYRVTAATAMNYFWILGEFIVLFFAYFVRDYRTFSICMTVIVSLVAGYFWLIPESVRYLIGQKRFDEADTIFRRIAKSNNKSYTYSVKDLDAENQVKKKVDFKIFFSNVKIIIKVLVSLINWFTNSFVYYGISLNTDLLGGDPYLNFLYMTIVELLGVVACHIVLIKFGRKLPYLINFLSVAAALIAIGFVPSSINWLKIVLVLIAKFSISFNFNTIYIMTSESYPTVIRNTAISVCSVAARIASTISPYVALLGAISFESLPYLLYAGFSIVSGLLYFFVMPETKDLDLPEDLDDLVNDSSSSKSSQDSIDINEKDSHISL